MSTKTRSAQLSRIYILLDLIELLLNDNRLQPQHKLLIVTVTISTSQICLTFRIIHESPQLDDAIQDLLEKTNQLGIEDDIITYDSKNACLEVRTKYDFELVQRYFEPYPVGMM